MTENAVRVTSPLRWFPEFLEIMRRRLQPQARVMGLSLVVGVIAGVGAVVFFLACQFLFTHTLDYYAGYRPNHPLNEPPLFGETVSPFVWWLLFLIPTAGGLISGILVYTFAPEAEGHGTDAAISAYHFHQGRIRPVVPIIKIIASAFTLGTGGSGGREGPIAQIGAGFGSFLGGVLHLRANERRILMAAGMGAGVGAIFRAPLAGALFAAEVLYSSPEFESDVIIPAGLATVIAYSIFALATNVANQVAGYKAGLGWKPLFELPAEHDKILIFNDPLQLVPYSVLALGMVVLAMLYTRTFYGLTHVFHRLPIKPHFKPAIGALLTGCLAVGLWAALGTQQVLSVLSFGYGALQGALKPEGGDQAYTLQFALILVAIAVGKILTTGLTIGSGGSGGVFGPSMVIGGCGGGALGIVWYALVHPVLPQMAPDPANFVIVGMAGFFAAAAKTPFSTLVMVSELTGNYNLLLPTLWVCAIAFLLSDEQSIYSSQLSSRSLSPAHQGDYVRKVLANLKVSQFLTPEAEVPFIHPGEQLTDIIDRLSGTTYHALPVIDAAGSLLGIISLEEVHLASQSPNLSSLIVAADLMRPVTPLRPDDRLDRALELFVENDVLALPVVDPEDTKHVVGIVKRSDVASTYLRYVHGVATTQEGVEGFGEDKKV
jgi:CIC family chloride channel protein